MASSRSHELIARAILGTMVVLTVPPTQRVEAVCGYADPVPVEGQLAVQPTIQPSQRAFIKWDPVAKVESISVQPKFEGNAKDFGMLVPTPSRPKIDEMPRDLFRDLSRYTLLFPMPQPMQSGLDVRPQARLAMSAVPPSVGGSGEGMSTPGSAPRKFVQVLETGVVGSLDYKILASNNSSMLFDWLKKNRYSFKGDEPTLKFYIAKGWVFTVMRIDSKQMKKDPDGKYIGEITPTRFTFSCEKCIYPLRITQHSVKDKTYALFYVQGPNQMDLPKQWSWKHSYRPVFLQYRLSGGADASFAIELRSRENWLRNRKRLEPNFEPTELEWAKRLTQSDMNILESPALFYATMTPMDLPPGSKVLSKSQLLQDYKSSYAQLKGTRNLKHDPLYSCFDYYPPEAGGFSVRYPDPIVGANKMLSTHYAFYPDRTYVPQQTDSVVTLKGLLQKGQWLTKFSRSFTKAEMTEDMVLDDLSTGQEVTYTRLLPNASAKQLERFQEQADSASGRQEVQQSVDELPPPPAVRLSGNIAPYRTELFQRIGANWHPRINTASSIVVKIEIAHDGSLLCAEILESSGNKKTDKAAIAAIEGTEFAPLPEWYKGESLTFKINMDKVLEKSSGVQEQP